MRTNIDIDDALMAAAQEATGLPTKRAVVEEGLRTLVRLREQQGIRALRGQIGFVEEPPESGGQVIRSVSVGGEVVVPDTRRDDLEREFARTRERIRAIEDRARRAGGGTEGEGEAEGAAGASDDDRRRR